MADVGFILLIGGIMISATVVFYTGSVFGIIPMVIGFGYGLLS
jgi:hypothetical protein